MPSETIGFSREASMIRPLTKQLVEAMWMDVWPGFAAQVDFGLDG